MNIPQVNQGVTDRNREQTRRILRLDGQSEAWIGGFVDSNLLNGSFTLDQVVGMLEAEDVEWHPEMSGAQNLSVQPSVGGWWLYTCHRAIRQCSLETNDPHDLTAAMDALIKVLEAKL